MAVTFFIFSHFAHSLVVICWLSLFIGFGQNAASSRSWPFLVTNLEQLSGSIEIVFYRSKWMYYRLYLKSVTTTTTLSKVLQCIILKDFPAHGSARAFCELSGLVFLPLLSHISTVQEPYGIVVIVEVISPTLRCCQGNRAIACGKTLFFDCKTRWNGFFCLFFCVSRIIFFEEFHWPTNSSGLHIVLIMDTSSGTIS